ncbi:uncharacterized protein Z520_07392 [Fonsecaea multimorphosa CBS 102226]|uniref:FAD/NAD(P)-binding domain-containing protein n=1 Tax=Fonsecaea multimorphosa CBS 102226 TaxID=1442371 RepID=A0A0D2KJ82_9EURO|nr:uncharacterized protein Z520_07392 [Fonsecaea multimorphosa CBS 102226]KIX96673.1 hypothetical protein Z520_07392 [Fonsecaea multimorphosa CBS 102226]OAL20754.1 hypothetical protein AYO22_08763 [Fonsecaea multimorphosa]
MAPRNVNLHPDNHLPGALESAAFDVVVIGSGPVGRQVASKTAEAGLSSVIIEEELWGGECPFWACMPSKAILRPGEALAAARQVGGARQLIAADRLVDVQGVFERRDKVTHKWDDEFFVNLSLKQKCSVVRGKGSIIAEKKVLVKNINGQEKTLVANHAVVIATGSDPVIPREIKGIDQVNYWTPRDATAADTVPEHLIIVGSGVVGCEIATAYSTFGSKVTMIGATAELLSRYEPEAGKRVREALKARNVDFHLSSRVAEAWKEVDGKISVKLGSGQVVNGSNLLIATGRKPRTKTIGLENVGLTGSLVVDQTMCASAAGGAWIYAIGDANGRAPLTHMGEYQGRIAAAAIIARAAGVDLQGPEPWSEFAATSDQVAVSQVVVTDPNVATVGLTLAEALKSGIKAVEVAVPFNFPGAWVYAEFDYDGWAQWVVDSERNVLVGATFVGREVGDLLHGSTVAIVGQVPLDRLKHAVPSFPTRSEIYGMLLEKWFEMRK